MESLTSTWLKQAGIDSRLIPALEVLVSALILALLAVLLALVSNFITRVVVQRAVKASKSKWDDHVLEAGVFRHLSALVPAIAVLWLFPLFFFDTWSLTTFLHRGVQVWIIALAVRVVVSFLESVDRIYRTQHTATSQKRPIKGYLQMLKVFAFIIGGILAVTTMFNVSPVGILGGFGAMSAVLLLVFKDSIMGVVSSLQLSTNDMVRIGDWIEMPKYGADGAVVDITLQSIMVSNWDMTITTIPLYALISDSFKNWRGMSESDGRRMKRAIHIDMKSVHFLTAEERLRLARLRLLKDHFAKKDAEIAIHNASLEIAEGDLISGRSLTNLGTYRAYITAYLNNHPQVQKSMTHMVRYLAGGPEGLPIELYFFSSDKNWTNYEGIQADIVDHLLAAMGEFGLRVFENPTGWELQSIADALKTTPVK